MSTGKYAFLSEFGKNSPRIRPVCVAHALTPADGLLASEAGQAWKNPLQRVGVTNVSGTL